MTVQDDKLPDDDDTGSGVPGPWRPAERVGQTLFWVREKHSAYWLDFRVWEAVNYADEPLFDGIATCGPQPQRLVSNTDEAGPSIQGFVKWDGCFQTGVPEIHWDTPQDVADFNELMVFLYDLRKRMENWQEQGRYFEENATL